MTASDSAPPCRTLEAPLRPEELQLYYDPPGTLRLTARNDHSYPGVKLYQSWPLTHPAQFLSLLNSKGDEIVMVDDLSALTDSSRAVAEEELRRRYLTAKVERVTAVKSEFGVTYWDVETHRGTRDFVLTSISEASQWLSPDHLVITDVSGNRFEFASISEMDPASRALLETVL